MFEKGKFECSHSTENKDFRAATFTAASNGIVAIKIKFFIRAETTEIERTPVFMQNGEGGEKWER